MEAMLFAAGLGSRLRPLTDVMPKALVPVAGRPLIDIVLERMKFFGVQHVVVNVHHFSEQLIRHLLQRDYGIHIDISDESAELLDTGGGLKRAVPLFRRADVPILLHNVDILSNVDLGSFYASHVRCDAALLVSERKTSRYLLFDDEMRLQGWTNVDTGEVRSPYAGLDVSSCRRMAFSGIHLFSPRLFPLLDAFPDKFSIMDFYLSVCHRVPVIGVASPKLKLLDVGKQSTLSRAESFLDDLS